MTTLTVEITVKEIERTETYTFVITDGKVHPPKGCFVDMDADQVVLGFGLKIDPKLLEKP
jgi:hypothetical protein